MKDLAGRIAVVTGGGSGMGRELVRQTDEISAVERARSRARIASSGKDGSLLSDDELRAAMEDRARKFLEAAPTMAVEAATTILDGVKADQWRILVGADAHILDRLVRESPDRAYDAEFFEGFAADVGWRLGR